jgi:hypothetical protein
MIPLFVCMYALAWVLGVLFVFLCVCMGFELRAVLIRQALYSLSNTSCPSCSGYFRDRFWPFTQASLEVSGVCHHTQVFFC